MPTTGEMLRLSHVNLTFHAGTVDERKALEDVSLSLEPGDFVTLIGSNGAGKSTLLNAVAGSYAIDSGHIFLDGKELTYQKEYRRAVEIGRLFQDPLKGTAPNMTIEENLGLAYLRGKRRGMGSGIKKSDGALFREALSALGLGLEDRMKTPVKLLSGGQRQALTLLMATIVTPKLLLLDEHTAALDPQTAKKVLDLTNEMVTEQNLTALMVTHNMKDAIQIGNRLIMMNDGQIIYDVAGEEKKKLTVEDLLEKFAKASGGAFANDRMLLSK